MNFVAIHRVGVLLALAPPGDFAQFRGVLSLPASGWEWILIYGVLLTSLEHSDGRREAESKSAWRGHRIVLGKAICWTTILMGVVITLSGAPSLALGALILGAPFNYLTMLAWRRWRQRATARRIEAGKGIRNVLIVGAGKTGRVLAAALDRDHPGGRVVVGFLDDQGPVGGDVCGRMEDLARVARAEFIDEIIVALPHEHELARRVAAEAHRNGLDTAVVADLATPDRQPAALNYFGGVPVLCVPEQEVPVEAQSLKRAADVVLSLIALVAVLPALLVIALAIKLDSAGPAIYCAPRVGKKGRRFCCYKLRTMVMHANDFKEDLRAGNERQGAFFKMVADPRVTRIGKFLRRYSLDELPQLWNVLCGDMSLVGPRPHPLDDVARYRLDDLRRLRVKPGMTGLWQVTARRDPSFKRNMALDLEYIEQWDLGMDLRILYKTISVVLQGSGA